MCPEFRRNGTLDMYTQRFSTLDLVLRNEPLKHEQTIRDTGSCPKSKCMSSCSCVKERACERGLYLRARYRRTCTTTRLWSEYLQRWSTGQHDEPP